MLRAADFNSNYGVASMIVFAGAKARAGTWVMSSLGSNFQ